MNTNLLPMLEWGTLNPNTITSTGSETSFSNPRTLSNSNNFEAFTPLGTPVSAGSVGVPAVNTNVATTSSSASIPMSGTAYGSPTQTAEVSNGLYTGTPSNPTGSEMSLGNFLGFTNEDGSLNWNGIGNGMNTVNAIGQTYLGFQQLDQSQDQFDFQKQAWQEQFDIQEEEYNRKVSERDARVAANNASAQTISAGGN